jgi:hypothetical protein
MWQGLLKKAETEGKIDLKKDYVSVGDMVIQGGKIFGVPDEIGNNEEILQHLEEKLGVLSHVSRTGAQQGYGHGKETLVLANRDGSIIYKASHINHCDGPGYSCSYSHGPWFEYGEYEGDSPTDKDLKRALDALNVLKEKFRT